MREVMKNPMVTLAELQRSFSKRWEKLPEGQRMTATLHWSGLYGRVARQKLLISEKHMKARLEFAKNHLVLLLCWILSVDWGKRQIQIIFSKGCNIIKLWKSEGVWILFWMHCAYIRFTDVQTCTHIHKNVLHTQSQWSLNELLIRLIF